MQILFLYKTGAGGERQRLKGWASKLIERQTRLRGLPNKIEFRRTAHRRTAATTTIHAYYDYPHLLWLSTPRLPPIKDHNCQLTTRMQLPLKSLINDKEYQLIVQNHKHNISNQSNASHVHRRSQINEWRPVFGVSIQESQLGKRLEVELSELRSVSSK